jgi:nitroreductase
LNKKSDYVKNVLPVILERHSPKAYDPDKKVSREVMHSVLEAARWAPSANNRQPWFFLVFDDTDSEAREKARSVLNEGNRIWADRAPVLVLACARIIRDNGKPHRYADHDLGLANENLLLQTYASGLISHPMAGFDKQAAREQFSIPEDYQPMVMIAIGYPGDDSEMPPEVQKHSRRIRERKPLEEISAWGNWPTQ